MFSDALQLRGFVHRAQQRARNMIQARYGTVGFHAICRDTVLAARIAGLISSSGDFHDPITTTVSSDLRRCRMFLVTFNEGATAQIGV